MPFLTTLYNLSLDLLVLASDAVARVTPVSRVPGDKQLVSLGWCAFALQGIHHVGVVQTEHHGVVHPHPWPGVPPASLQEACTEHHVRVAQEEQHVLESRQESLQLHDLAFY